MTASPDARRPQIADADYYRLGYQLAAQLMNRNAAGQNAAPRPLGAPPIVADDPLAVALALVRDAQSMLAWYGRRRRMRLRWRRPTAQEERMQTFLAATIEPSCALLAARCLHQLGRDDEAAALLDHVLALANAGELSYRAYYALACLEANDGDGDDAILYLGRALYEAPRARRDKLAEWALSDPAFASVRKAVGALVATLDPPVAAAAPAAAATAAPRDTIEADIASLERAVEELARRPLDAAAARVQLASAYQLAERTQDAVALDARIAADLEEQLTPDHFAALAARAVLMTSRKLLRGGPDRPALDRRALELREALSRALAELG